MRKKSCCSIYKLFFLLMTDTYFSHVGSRSSFSIESTWSEREKEKSDKSRFSSSPLLKEFGRSVSNHLCVCVHQDGTIELLFLVSLSSRPRLGAVVDEISSLRSQSNIKRE